MQWSAITQFPTPKNLRLMAKLAPAATAPFGARYLTRGTAVAAFEAGLKERVVIVEYPSLEKATLRTTVPPIRKHREHSAMALCATFVSSKD